VTDQGKAVFLSYASQDAEAAQHLCEALRNAGVEVWFGCFVGRIVLAAHFMGVRPAQPRAELGLTYSFNQHGGVVYLTHFESIFLMALIVSAALLIAVGGYIINNSRVAQR
jgi:hypothetical protein